MLATYFVDTTADTDNGICAADNAAGNLACSIRSAILAAEARSGADTIQIPDGIYVNDRFGSFDLIASQDLAFLGNASNPAAVVIDGANQNRLFDMFGSGSLFTVSFQGMTLQNGVASDGSGGGAINAGGDVNLVLDLTVVQDNLADVDFFTMSESSGGGIQASGNVTITDSIIRNNVATASGGGIDFGPFDNKSLTITDTTISGNVAGNPTIDLGVGGGAFLRGSLASATLTRVVVDGNSAGDSGGGIYNHNVALVVNSSSFLNNDALGSDSGGGGLYVLGSGPSGSPFSINGGSFRSNTAVSGAGGFEAVDNAGAVDGAIFSQNQVTGAGTSFDQGGGAIAIISTLPANASPVTLRNLFVSQNSAPSAGGIAAVDADLTIEDSTISGNSATGAAIGSAGGLGAVASAVAAPLVIRRSSFLSNTAVLQAGGIGAFDVNLQLSDSVVDGNEAFSGRAGGIGLAGQVPGLNPFLTTDSVTVSNNRAGGDGGGIGVQAAGMSLLNTTVSGNQSLSGSGGGLALISAIAGSQVRFSTIVSNQADLGSNIAAQNSTVSFEGALIADGTGVAVNSTFVSLGGNLDEFGTLGLSGTGDQSGVNPFLGPLQDNGGQVPTHALLSGSPAIDAGPASGPAVDARGTARPLDGDGIGGAAFDVGAFEAAATNFPRLTIADVLVNEAEGFATIFVTLEDPTSDAFTLTYSTISDTAADPDDYEFTSGFLDFDGVQFEQVSFEIPIVDDFIAEGRERLSIVLSVDSASESLDVSDVGVVSIVDDDEAVLFIQDTLIDEASGLLTVEVSLFGNTDGPFTVELSTGQFLDGAVAGEDYDSNFETLFFDGFDGEVQTFFVTILDDFIVEGDEEFLIVADAIRSNGSNVRFDGYAAQVDLLEVERFTPVSGFSQAISLDATGDLAYLADNSGLYVIDVDDPFNPVELGSYSGPDGSPFDVQVVGNLAYILSDVLEVLDVSDPANITRLGQYIHPTLFFTSLDVVGTSVYLGLTDSEGFDGGLAVVDASDPASPILAGEIALSQVDDVSVVGNVAYLAQPFRGLGLIDVTNPASMFEIGSADAGEAFVVTVSGTTAYVGGFEGLSVWDVTNPGNIELLGTYVGDDEVASIGLDLNNFDGPILYLGTFDFSAGAGGTVETLDLSDLGNIQSKGKTDTFGGALNVIADGDFVYAAQGLDGMGIARARTALLANVTIINDDTARLTVSDVSVDERTGTASVTVTLDNEVQGGFSYEFTTNDGTAKQGTDYTTTTGSFSTGSPGEQQTITIPILFDSQAEGIETFSVSLFNVSPFGNVAPDAIDASVIGTVTITESGGVDLAITKSDSLDPVQPGDDLTYTLVVTNNGTIDATGVVLTDVLPPGLTFEIGSVDGDVSRVSESGGTVTADVGILEAGQSATIEILLIVESTALNPLANTASVTSNEVDLDPSDNTVTEQTSVDIYAANDDVYFVLEASVSNPLDVLSNDFQGMFGPVTIVSVSVLGTVGTVLIGPGSTSVLYTPPPGFNGPDNFDYTIQDSTGRRSTAQVLINVTAVNDVDLATSMVEDVDPVGPNDTVTFTVAITNLGTDIANNVVSTTLIDPAFTIVSTSVSRSGSIDVTGNTVTTFLTSLDGGEAATVSIVVASGANGGTFTSTSSVASSEIDLDPSNDSASQSTMIVVPASIFGHIFCDLDGLGVENPGEEVAGVTVFLDTDGDRILDSGERSTLTDANGDYRFNNVTDSFVTVVAEVPLGCNTIPYQPGVVRSTIGVGELARSITHVDIDGDNDLDLLVASDKSNSLAVLVNNGGNFSLDREIALGDRPQSVAAWRTPSSSSPLIAVAGVGTPLDGGSLFVFELGGPMNVIEVGNGPVDVIIDDFDLNGEADILVATLRSSNVQLFMNGADEPELIAVARLARTVASGDVNNDGLPDIVVGGYGYPGDPNSELVLLLGDGTGAFGEPIVASIAQRLVSAKVVDLTDDFGELSKTRVAALSAAGEFKVFELVGDELVETTVLVVSPGSNSFDVGDFNRDGLTDLAISNEGQQRIALFVGDGDGNFVSIITLDNVAAPSDLVIGDLDNDSQDDDLAVTNLYQDSQIGLSGPPSFFLPSATTVLRLDVAEAPVVVGGTATQVDFAFQSADPDIRMDVSGDGLISALDALRVINAVARNRAEGEGLGSRSRSSTDVNGDGRTTAVDALMVINFLADHPGGQVSVEGLDLLADEDDHDDERMAAVDVVLSRQLF